MKKLLLTLALALTSLLPAAAIGFDWGVTGGLNLSKLSLKGDIKQNVHASNQAGWFIGPKANVSLIAGFGLDGALLYNQQRYSLEENGGNNASHTQRSLEIPINLRYNIGLSSLASVYVATGPQFDFNLGHKDWLNDTFSQQNTTASWNVGAGVRLLKHLEVGVGYNFALGKTGRSIASNIPGYSSVKTNAANYHANTFKLQATIYF